MKKVTRTRGLAKKNSESESESGKTRESCESESESESEFAALVPLRKKFVRLYSETLTLVAEADRPILKINYGAFLKLLTHFYLQTVAHLPYSGEGGLQYDPCKMSSSFEEMGIETGPSA